MTSADSNPGRKHVAVLAGGFSAEREISIQSASEVVANLAASEFEVTLVRIDRDAWTAEVNGADIEVNRGDFSIEVEGQSRPFDAAFIAVHGTPGEDGLLPAYLELLGIPHTTCGPLAAAATFHKAMCKELIRDLDVGLAKSVTVKKGDAAPEHLVYPVFVKPNQNGSSCGIFLAHDLAELKEAMEKSFEFDSELILEERIQGTEVTCGVWQREGRVETLPLTEIVSGENHEFFDYSAKYTAGEAQEITPARISDEQRDRCWALSRAIYEKLGLQGLIRVDYIMSGEEFFFLEVNTVPGMSGASIAPKMALAAGFSLTEFYANMVREALAQAESRKSNAFSPDHQA